LKSKLFSPHATLGVLAEESILRTGNFDSRGLLAHQRRYNPRGNPAEKALSSCCEAEKANRQAPRRFAGAVLTAAAEKMFGCPVQEAIGHSIDRSFPLISLSELDATVELRIRLA
jgi:hypothetical protein